MSEDELFAELLRVGPGTFEGLEIAERIIALRKEVERLAVLATEAK